MVWQKGNNKAIALDNIATDGLERIETLDSWMPNPKVSAARCVSETRTLLDVLSSQKPF